MDAVTSDLPILMMSFILGLIVMYTIIKMMNENNDKNQSKRNEQNSIKKQSDKGMNNDGAKKQTRVYVDGCWDVMHSGHYNALRQAKALGDILVVGVHSDEEIARNKREPVMNNEQRMAAVSACKWADEVAFDVPYSPSRQLIDKLNCDYLAHGDDIPIAADGRSCYHEVMDRLKIFRRTPGVSTTHLIQRLLDAAKYDIDDDKEEKEEDLKKTSSWSSFLA
eukprot:457731_1